MAKTIRWGIIGVGDVTEVKSGPALYKAANSELVAVMRRTGEKAKDFAERHNVPRWYDDGDALINDPDVDVVYIATPQNAHKDYTIKAAAAGKPVYCEKPMALTYAECRHMLTACSKAGVPLWIAYYRRAMPRFVKIKDLLDSKAIGEVRAVSIRLTMPNHVQPDTPHDELDWHFLPEISGGGMFADMGCHQIDLLQFYLGQISQVYGSATNQEGLYPVADSVSASFRFESGVVGTGLWSLTAGKHVDEIILTGTEGQIRFEIFAPTPFTLENQAGVQTFDIGYPEHVHQPLVETIIAELNGEGQCPSTGLTAASTNWVIDEILKDYREQHRQ